MLSLIEEREHTWSTDGKVSHRCNPAKRLCFLPMLQPLFLQLPCVGINPLNLLKLGVKIYAQDYRDLEHLRSNLEAFIEQYYNRLRPVQKQKARFGTALSHRC